jgi:hypothetical protein
MIRALRVLALILVAASAVYMVAVYASSPDRMPMQWDLHNRPTWTAPKAAFFGMFAAGLLFGLALTFVRPAAAVGASLVFADTLLLHVCYQAATGGRFLAMPVGVAATLVLVVCFAAAGVTVVEALKAARNPGGGAPPSSRPRAS